MQEAPAGLYFRGFLERPDMAAVSLLAVARVARTSFYVHPSSVARAYADPVVTSEPGALRFESFSGCCGVHARFDVLPEGVDAETVAPGTVNVDFNEPMRTALARIVAREPLRLQVGFDAVELETFEGNDRRAARAAARPLGQGLRRGPGRGGGARARP